MLVLYFLAPQGPRRVSPPLRGGILHLTSYTNVALAIDTNPPRVPEVAVSITRNFPDMGQISHVRRIYNWEIPTSLLI